MDIQSGRMQTPPASFASSPPPLPSLSSSSARHLHPSKQPLRQIWRPRRRTPARCLPLCLPACPAAECRRVHRSITDEGHPVDALYYRAAYLFCHQHPFRRRYLLNRRSSERGIRVPFPLIRRIRPTGRCPGGKPFCFSRWNNLRYRREIYT